MKDFLKGIAFLVALLLVGRFISHDFHKNDYDEHGMQIVEVEDIYSFEWYEIPCSEENKVYELMAYDSENEYLYIDYQTPNTVYRYSDVSESEWEALNKSDSFIETIECIENNNDCVRIRD